MRTLKILPKINYVSNVYGLARALLAISTLSTLLFNSNTVLFYYGLDSTLFMNCNSLTSISIYCLLNEHLILAKLISVAVLVMVIIGIYPRFTGILHWWVAYSFSVSSYIVDGGDQIAAILTFFLIPITLVDNRNNHWKKKAEINYYASVIAYYSVLLMKLQVAIIYFHAVVGKFYVAEWLNGTALYYWLHSQNFGAPDWVLFLLTPVLRNSIGITLMTWAVLGLELMLACSIFMRNGRVKMNLFYLGVLFHFGILIVHGLFSFFFSMAGALVLLLVYPYISDFKAIFKYNRYVDRRLNFTTRFPYLVFIPSERN